MRAAPSVCLACLKLCFWCCASGVPKSGVLYIVLRAFQDRCSCNVLVVDAACKRQLFAVSCMSTQPNVAGVVRACWVGACCCQPNSAQAIALQVVGRCLTWQAVWFRNEFGSHALCRIKQPASRREVGICSVCVQCSCVVVRCPCTVQAAASLCGLDSTTQIWVYTQAAPAHTSADVYCGGCACHCASWQGPTGCRASGAWCVQEGADGMRSSRSPAAIQLACNQHIRHHSACCACIGCVVCLLYQ